MRKIKITLFVILAIVLVLIPTAFAADWYPVSFKFSWDRSVSGFCPTDEQCLVDPSGNQNNNNQPDKYSTDNPPECIADTQYIKDYYCDSGLWTSRTKLIALTLLEFAEEESPDDFTLFCGPYQETLNNYKYVIDSNSVEEFLEENRVNNFCVLEYNNKVAFGTSLNLDIDDNYYSFLNALGESESKCNNQKNNNNNFESCNNNIWYNHNTKSVIYLESGSLSTPATDLFTRYFKNPFQRIIDYISNVVHDTSTPGKDFSVFDKTTLFDNVYISRSSGKYIFAFLELDQSLPAKDYLGVKYSNIDLGSYPCDNLIKLYELGANAYCEQQTGSDFIVVSKREQEETTPIIEAWKDLTAKLRPK